jgi:hypothetical protein
MVVMTECLSLSDETTHLLLQGVAVRRGGVPHEAGLGHHETMAKVLMECGEDGRALGLR